MNMVTMVLPPKKQKIGIEADIENLKKRLKIQKEWVAKTEAELEALEKEYNG